MDERVAANGKLLQAPMQCGDLWNQDILSQKRGKPGEKNHESYQLTSSILRMTTDHKRARWKSLQTYRIRNERQENPVARRKDGRLTAGAVSTPWPPWGVTASSAGSGPSFSGDNTASVSESEAAQYTGQYTLY
jgi:hypothetical protein